MDNQFYIDKLHASIEALEERLRGSDALIVLWETRATRAEARIEVLEKHKRLQTEDVMNLGAALGKAQVRIEALEAALHQTGDLAQALCVACRSEVPDKQFLNWAHNEVGVTILGIYNVALDQSSPSKEK